LKGVVKATICTNGTHSACPCEGKILDHMLLWIVVPVGVKVKSPTSISRVTLAKGTRVSPSSPMPWQDLALTEQETSITKMAVDVSIEPLDIKERTHQ
jgi:hypothetical protein